MAGDREEAAEWLRRSAARYRESWDAGAATDAWGRPIGAMKALLIAGDDAGDAARWALDAGAAGRSRRSAATPGCSRCSSSAATRRRALSPRRSATTSRATSRPRSRRSRQATPAAYRGRGRVVRRSFEEREAFLEDVPVPDTALALDALAARRGLV